ncbi:MAG: RNA polymerase-binding protein DksA [Geobacteraceae bacterium]|nr:MAG: RNA polymerase-binding protein DksA [Geobacteraceae bacterium]RPI73039.1 MAG: RNA polymerase-binding protein DksA [Geobacteraceae bacterium]
MNEGKVAIIRGGAIMKRKELEFFQKSLKLHLEELTKKSDAAIAGLLSSSDRLTDRLDSTSFDLDRDLRIRMLNRESKLIFKIKKALEKIEEQIFGICEFCGEEIDIKRLKLRPVADLCIGCKVNQEKVEKLAGD